MNDEFKLAEIRRMAAVMAGPMLADLNSGLNNGNVADICLDTAYRIWEKAEAAIADYDRMVAEVEADCQEDKTNA